MSKERFPTATALLNSQLNELGWSGAQLAKKVGLSRSSINRYLNGETVPKLNNAHKIIAVLKFSEEQNNEIMADWGYAIWNTGAKIPQSTALSSQNTAQETDADARPQTGANNPPSFNMPHPSLKQYLSAFIQMEWSMLFSTTYSFKKYRENDLLTAMERAWKNAGGNIAKFEQIQEVEHTLMRLLALLASIGAIATLNGWLDVFPLILCTIALITLYTVLRAPGLALIQKYGEGTGNRNQ